MNNLNIAGLDVGYAEPPKKTNGVGIWRQDRLQLEKRCRRENAWEPIITNGKFDVIAVDGPIISPNANKCIKRNVERIFIMSLFQKRCKPGMSHSGQGLRLREEAGLAADKLHVFVPGSIGIPEIRRNSAIVEAFPNAFLGVCLSNQTYDAMPKLRRRKKFDWLYEKAVEQKIIDRMEGLSKQEQIEWQGRFDREKDHELRAAIVCLLTALLVAKGYYVAVGDKVGGWFFLPPLSAWTNWAKETLKDNIEKINVSEAQQVQVISKSGSPT